MLGQEVLNSFDDSAQHEENGGDEEWPYLIGKAEKTGQEQESEDMLYLVISAVHNGGVKRGKCKVQNQCHTGIKHESCEGPVILCPDSRPQKWLTHVCIVYRKTLENQGLGLNGGT